MKRRIFFDVHAALFTESVTNENPDYCDCAARLIAAMIIRATILNFVAKDSIKER